MRTVALKIKDGGQPILVNLDYVRTVEKRYDDYEGKYYSRLHFSDGWTLVVSDLFEDIEEAMKK